MEPLRSWTYLDSVKAFEWPPHPLFELSPLPLSFCPTPVPKHSAVKTPVRRANMALGVSSAAPARMEDCVTTLAESAPAVPVGWWVSSSTDTMMPVRVCLALMSTGTWTHKPFWKWKYMQSFGGFSFVNSKYVIKPDNCMSTLRKGLLFKKGVCPL